MPAFSEPYKNLETTTPVRKAQLLREIAARTYIKESVVEEVLESFKEVATEEIINKGSFTFSGLFSVRGYEAKATKAGFGYVPARTRLRVRLGDRVKKLWNGRQKAAPGAYETFKEAKENYLDSTGSDLRDSIGLLNDVSDQPVNPFLEDDDDY